MEAGEAHVVVRTIDRDVLLLVFVEGSHQFIKVFLPACFPQVFGGKVSVHAGAIPIRCPERFAVVFHIQPVFFAKTFKEISGDPQFIGSLFRAFAKDLEFPLPLGHLGVDALMVNAGIKTDIQMFLYDLAGEIADVFIADPGVVGTLWSRVATFGKTERTTFLIQEIFLLEAEPAVGVVENSSPVV